MGNLLTMAIPHSIKHLSEDISSIRFRETSFLNKSIKQFTPLTHICDDIVIALIFICFVDFNYIWMINFLQDLHFIYKLNGISDGRFFNQFDCPWFFCYFVSGTINSPIGPFSQFLSNLIVVSGFAIFTFYKASFIKIK